MEESERSKYDEVLYKTLDLCYEINEGMEGRFVSIEEKLQKIFWFIEFHLGEVPIKYRKAFPKEGEYPYIKIDKHEIDPTTSKIYPHSDFLIPKDSEVLQTTKDRMLKFSEKANAEGVWNKWKGRPKPGSSVTSSMPSASPDSHQANTSTESFLPCSESPDHKNPPSQT